MWPAAKCSTFLKQKGLVVFTRSFFFKLSSAATQTKPCSFSKHSISRNCLPLRLYSTNPLPKWCEKARDWEQGSSPTSVSGTIRFVFRGFCRELGGCRTESLSLPKVQANSFPFFTFFNFYYYYFLNFSCTTRGRGFCITLPMVSRPGQAAAHPAQCSFRSSTWHQLALRAAFPQHRSPHRGLDAPADNSSCSGARV